MPLAAGWNGALKTWMSASRHGKAAQSRRFSTTLERLPFEGLPPSSPVVVALGGGAFAQAENAALLQAAGALTVFLDAPVDELWLRCQNEDEPDERPLKSDERQFRQLYEARRPHYMNALLRVDTAGKDVESIAAEIIASLRLQFKLSQKDLGEEK